MTNSVPSFIRSSLSLFRSSAAAKAAAVFFFTDTPAARGVIAQISNTLQEIFSK